MKYFSASQLKVYNQCPRKWYFRYILKVRTPPSAAMLQGTDLHRMLEQYLTEGSIRETKYHRNKMLLAEAIPLLPRPRDPNICVEMPTHKDEPRITLKGLHMRGFIDLVDMVDGVIRITDHKTSSDPDKYGLREHQIKDDIQLMAYAWYALTRSGLNQIVLRHIYYPTKGALKIRQVSATVSIEDVKRWRANVEATIEKMKRHHEMSVDRGPNIRRALAERGECGSYGGCEYLSKCPVDSSPLDWSAVDTAQKSNRPKPTKGIFGDLL